ncbi:MULTISPECIES: transcriptional repressor [unclassified Paenibacillus]|uniref:Fur family transcriptional regulator n=1 Tax=unclassified Paenibacillus TaxID=185978 RepID=UPI001AE24954|nr:MULTISPECIES: transcriptional repressor [unclassified Paenibacillus]MBP1153428.1 Fe2+ or Zn2+ uptake regulation protein [Paenibacillus sp. PvP091]MBP1171189.1 Fe2+ or Zn2+ uptake regulation protein [Paenibacillus sp. PvR098]MBP2442217.1 Fe2+ or Zn2+ uptake regulation protein [Paenibacillus sp. PvP052]
MNKINLTAQRKAVLEAIQYDDGHPTAAEVMERLRLQGQQFAYATVYNSLKYLTDVGLLRELKLGETASRYDARMDDHHHIVCRQCGRVDEVLNPTPTAWITAVEKETKYSINYFHVVFEGVCGTCAQLKA